MDITVDSFRKALGNRNSDDWVRFDGGIGEVKVKHGSAVVAGYEVVLTESERLQNIEVRGLLLNALKRDIGSALLKNPQMKAHLDGLTKRLLGDLDSADDPVRYKPLSAREVREMLDETADLKWMTVVNEFNQANPGLIRIAQMNFTEAEQLKTAPGVSAKDVETALSDFRREELFVFQELEHGCKVGVADLKAAYENFTAAIGRLRLRSLVLEFGPRLDQAVEGFSRNWEQEFGAGQGVMTVCGESVKAQLTARKERFLNEMRGLACNARPDSKALAALQSESRASFEELLADLTGEGGRMFDRAKQDRTQLERDDARLEQALDELAETAGEETVVRLFKANGWSGGQLLDFNDWFRNAAARLREDVSLQKQASGLVASHTLQEAARRVRSFREEVLRDLDSLSGGGGLSAFSERHPLPAVRIVSVDQDETERRLMEDGAKLGIGEELSLMTSPAAQVAKEQFGLLRNAVGEMLEEYRKAGDRAAAGAFGEAAEAAKKQLEGVVVAALKSGLSLEDGFGALFAAELDKLVGLYQKDVVGTASRRFGQAAQAVLRRLDVAAEGSANADTAEELRATADALRKAVEEKCRELDGLARQGQLATTASVAAVLAELERLTTGNLQRIDRESAEGRSARLLKKAFSREAERPAIALTAGLVAAPRFMNAFASLAAGRFGSLSDLEKATAEETRFWRIYGGAKDEFTMNVRTLTENAMLAHAGAENFVERDEEGQMIDLNDAGRKLCAQVAEESLTEAWTRLRLVGLTDDRVVSAEEALKLTKSEVEKKIGRLLDINMNAEEAAPEEPEVNPLVYPRGSGVFGLDVARLSREQTEGLRLLVLGTLTDYAAANLGREGVPSLDDILMHGASDSLFELAYASCAEALKKGRLDLSKLSIGAVRLGKKLYANAMMMNSPFESETQIGFCTKDMAKIFSVLQAIGLPQSFYDGLPANVDGAANLLGALYTLCRNDVNGMQAACMRLFGKSIEQMVGALGTFLRAEDQAIVRKIKENTATPDEVERHRLFMKYDRLVNYKTAEEAKYWRSHFDPLMLASDKEVRAAEFFMCQARPTATDQNDILRIRRALETLAPGSSVEVTFAGVGVVLTRDAGSRLTAGVKMLKSRIVKANNAQGWTILREGESSRRPVCIAVPADVESMIAHLDDIIVNDVGTYGAAEVLGVLQRSVERGAVSSRTRQLAMDVLAGLADLRTVDLCGFATGRLVQVAQTALGEPGFTGLALAARKAKVMRVLGLENGEKATGPVMLNSEGTFELYARWRAASPEEQGKVFVPDPPKVYKGESPEQSRTRQLHEFAADLIQPHDSTGYDFDRRGGMSEPEVMRKALLAHFNEVKMLLRDRRLVGKLDIPGAEGVPLSGVKAAVKSLMDGLSALYEGCQSMDEFMGKIGAGQADALLCEMRTRLTDASTAVMKNLQAVFVRKLGEACRKNAGSLDEPVGNMSLDELANSSRINVDAGYGKFLLTVIGDYFSSMDEVDCNRMAATVMRLSRSDASVGETLGVLLKGAGPILQKLMQGLPQSSLPEDLREAVADLKSSLAPIPEEAVRAYLYDMVLESNGRITGIDVVKSLGAASVGQAFLCRVKTADRPEGEECVLKILRPDVQSRAKREEAFFIEKASACKLGSMLNERFARIFEELDLMVEADHVIDGAVYDPGMKVLSNGAVSSMKLYPKINATMNTLALVKAPGVPYDKYGESVEARLRGAKGILSGLSSEVKDDGSVKYKVPNPYELLAVRQRLSHLLQEIVGRHDHLIDFVKMWMQEAVFGSGFFHGDVHSGNVMSDTFGLTVIDYGNVSRFTADQQKYLKRMMAHAFTRNVSGFLDNFGKMMSETGRKSLSDNREAVERKLTEIFSKGTGAESGKLFVAALQTIQNTGVEIPGSLFNLMQSMQRLDETVNGLNLKIEEIRSAIEQLEIARSEPGSSDEHYMDRLFANVSGDTLENMSKALQSRVPDRRILTALLDEAFGTFGNGNAVQRMSDDIVAACKAGRAEFEKLIGELMRNIEGVSTGQYLFEDVVGPILDRVDRTTFFRPDNNEEWRAFADEFARKIWDTMASAPFAVIDAFAVGEDAEDPDSFTDAVGDVIEKNKKKMLSAFGLSNIFESTSLGASALSTSIANAVIGSRRDVAHTRFAEAKTSLGLFDREVRLVEGFSAEFRLSKEVSDSFSSDKWPTKAEARTKVLEAVRFNLRELKAHMKRNGLGTRMEKDPELFRKYVKATAIGFQARYESFDAVLKKMPYEDYAGLRAAAEGDADLQTFLDEVRRLPVITVNKDALAQQVRRLFSEA